MKHRMTGFILLSCLMLSVQVRAAWVEDAAPAFNLTAPDGKPVVFPASPASKVTIINFWASWCPPCKIEFPELNKLARDYSGRGVRVVAVTVDKALANVNQFLQQSGISSPALEVARDPDSKAARAFSAKAMPTSFIIDRKGVIRYAHMGFLPGDDAKWRKEIDTLLNEPEK